MFVYENGQQWGFTNNCHGDVLAQRNPTCDMRTYTGGVQTCLHNFFLLDADQEVPWQDQPLVYRLKFRFWFQELPVAPAPQIYGVRRWGFSMGNAISEYDVPKCPPGTPVDQCTHILQDVGTPPAWAKYLIATHHHCHAPTCLAATLYFNDTGELICNQRSLLGKGTSDKFDEKVCVSLSLYLAHSLYLSPHALLVSFVCEDTRSRFNSHPPLPCRTTSRCRPACLGAPWTASSRPH